MKMVVFINGPSTKKFLEVVPVLSTNLVVCLVYPHQLCLVKGNERRHSGKTWVVVRGSLKSQLWKVGLGGTPGAGMKGFRVTVSDNHRPFKQRSVCRCVVSQGENRPELYSGAIPPSTHTWYK